MSKNKQDRRSSWRNLFEDHPGAATKDPSAFHESDTGNTKTAKIYCKACLIADVHQIMEGTSSVINQGRPVVHRTEQEIQTECELMNYNMWLILMVFFEVWERARSSPGIGGFILYASQTCTNHLRFCPNQPASIRQDAELKAKSPKKHLRYSPYAAPRTGTILPSPMFPSGSRSSSQMLPPQSLPSSRLNSPALHVQTSALPSPINSTAPSPQLSVLSFPLIDPLPLLNGTPLYNQSPAMSSLYVEPSTSLIFQPPGLQGWGWSEELQIRFEIQIARLTAAAGLPLSWVDNPEWIDFIHIFLPAAKSPSRKVLTTRLIPGVVEEYSRIAKESASGQNATIQADGWTGANFHHLLAFMIAVKKKVCSTISYLN